MGIKRWMSNILPSPAWQEEGIVRSILAKLGTAIRIWPNSCSGKSTAPKVGGAGAAEYFTPRLNQLLESAFREADQFKDEYVSTSTCFWPSFRSGGIAARILKQAGVDRMPFYAP